MQTDDNILGLNVLEHFKYLLDTATSEIFFADNDNYKGPLKLRCVSVHSVSESPSAETRISADPLVSDRK